MCSSRFWVQSDSWETVIKKYKWKYQSEGCFPHAPFPHTHNVQYIVSTLHTSWLFYGTLFGFHLFLIVFWKEVNIPALLKVDVYWVRLWSTKIKVVLHLGLQLGPEFPMLIRVAVKWVMPSFTSLPWLLSETQQLLSASTWSSSKSPLALLVRNGLGKSQMVIT